MDVRNNFRKGVLDLAPYSVSGHPARIKLNQNESPFDIPADLKKEIIEEFFKIQWNRYPDVFSKMLPERLSEIHGLPIESFIVSNGSNELIYTVEMSIIRDGIEVLIPQPTFYLYEKVANILGGNIVKVFAKSDLDFNEEKIIEQGRRMKQGLIVISSPNNPTGKSATDEFIIELLKSTSAIVLIDEAYIEFSRHSGMMHLTQEYKNLVVLRTFSKAFCLAGLRVGYLAANPETAHEILKVKIPFTVNGLSEFTAVKLLDHRQIFNARVQFLKQQRTMMMSELRKLDGVEVVDSEANFFLFSTPFPAGEVFDELLEKKSVLVRDVSSYPMIERCLRVNAGSEEESSYFVESMRAILARKAVRNAL